MFNYCAPVSFIIIIIIIFFVNAILTNIYFSLPLNQSLICTVKGTGRSEEAEISRNVTFSEKILTESCGIGEDVDEIFCQNSP